MGAWWLEPAGVPAVRLAAGGDVGLVGRLRTLGRRHGYDAALGDVAAAVSGAALATANLEFPVSARDPGHEFRHDPEAVAALRRAGLGVVSLANNHMMDLGVRGLEATLEACAAAGLAAVGAGADEEAARRPATSSAEGRRIGFLAYCTPHHGSARRHRPGVAPLESGRVREDLRALRSRVDVVVVHAHWGSMYVDHPPPAVRAWARLLADEGADLVLGHHPHVLQGVERMGRALVCYSLGDLAFDPSAGEFYAEAGREWRRRAAVFHAGLADGGAGLELKPLLRDQDFVSRTAEDEEAGRIAGRVRALSAALASPGAFAELSAPVLVRYGLQSAAHYLRARRWGRLWSMARALRPRHLPLLWSWLRRGRSREGAA